MKRISIVGMLGLVGLLAFSFAAAHAGTEGWTRATFSMTLGLLTLGLLGSILRTRPWGAWVGFSLFGWCYFLFGVVGVFEKDNGSNPPAARILDQIPLATFHPPPQAPDGLDTKVDLAWLQGFSDLGQPVLESHSFNDPIHDKYKNAMVFRSRRVRNSRAVANDLIALVVGAVGSVLGRILAARAEPPPVPGAPRVG